MATSSSNLKQARLDFSVSKRTGSINKAGKPSPSQTPPKTVELALPKSKPSAKVEIVESEISDFITISSDEEDTDEIISTDAASSKRAAAKKDALNPATRTRSSTKKSSPNKKITVQKEYSNDIESPGMFGTSRANSQGETNAATKKAAPGTADSNEASILPELKIKNPKWSKHYAEVKAKMGHMPAIHGEMQNRIHEILRVFDDSYEYGPCVGVTRLERWNRAKALGLNPPKEVEEILNTKQGASMPEYSQSVFFGEV
ncbi:hypothetical protein BDN70DRAFT_884430 [Pholiota conissans]|uniref:DNA polymerase delta subunit 4 n=1 Tax=Pholiota conissans TaxID=109636 RepID=A0A9P5YVU4_9AGAR|nr:hypothetical protein BDN70DRAFT_884430 [Pholiota conissans]